MSRRQSKRDQTIARASLLVYPVAHAYDEFLSKCQAREVGEGFSQVKRITIRIPCSDGKYDIMYHQTNPTAGVFKGTWDADDWEVGFPCRNHSCEHRVNWKNELIPALQWQNNFARCALEIHEVRSAFYVFTAVRNMLLSKNLLLNVAWAKAVAEVISKRKPPRSPRECREVDNLGLLYSTQWWNLTHIGDGKGAVEEIRQLAKNFPVTQPSDIYPASVDLTDRVEKTQFALSASDVE